MQILLTIFIYNWGRNYSPNALHYAVLRQRDSARAGACGAEAPKLLQCISGKGWIYRVSLLAIGQTTSHILIPNSKIDGMTDPKVGVTHDNER